jgi:hypothetical protein
MNACGFVIGFLCVVNFVVTVGLAELNSGAGVSSLLEDTDGLLRGGRPRFFPLLVPLTIFVGLDLIGVVSMEVFAGARC